MKTKDFIRRYGPCTGGAKWALSIGGDMADVWDAMIEQGKHEWLLWTATRLGVFPDAVLRKFVCRFVRETPLSDGRRVWDLLKDERSRKVVEVAERYADGKATDRELQAARAAAFAAYEAAYAARAARAAAYYNASHAAYVAAYAARAAANAAAYEATRAAARAANAAQAQMIAELGNPFKERAGR
jgi:hypothetical protein